MIQATYDSNPAWICGICLGRGLLPDPRRKWWQFWKTVYCWGCGGDGKANPKGWPSPGIPEKHGKF